MGIDNPLVETEDTTSLENETVFVKAGTNSKVNYFGITVQSEAITR